MNHYFWESVKSETGGEIFATCDCYAKRDAFALMRETGDDLICLWREDPHKVVFQDDAEKLASCKL